MVSLTTIFSIALALSDSALALLGPKPYSQESNDLFNVIHHLSTGSPNHEAPGLGIDKTTPDTCKIDQAHLIMRHGERYPTKSTGKLLEKLLKSLKNATVESDSNGGPFAFVQDYDYFVSNSSLYEQETFYNAYSGLLDAFKFGSELRLRYNHLVNNSDITPVFTAGQKRVYDTAVAFSQGFFGNGVAGDYRLVVLPETAEYGANSLTNTKGCPNFQSDDYSEAILEDENLSYAQQEADRLNRLSGFNLTTDDIFTIGTYCAYETNVKGESKFCDVLSMNGFIAYAHHQDLDKWYSEGPGYNMSYASGSAIANATIKLLNEGPGEGKLYLSFTHDNDILRYITGLGLYDNEEDLPLDHMVFNRAWKTSDIVPLGGRLLTERLSCRNETSGEDQYYVRLILNDQVFPVPDCFDGPGYSCPLEDYISGVNEGLVDYASACDIADDIPDSLTFYWDWKTSDYPAVADEDD